MPFGLLLTALFSLSTPAISLNETAPAPITIEDAYAHPPIGAGKVGVAFMSIDNTSDKPLQLVGVTSPAFDRIELHTHSHEDGIMRMQSVESIDLPAGETVQLASGGLHLMLFGPTREITVGEPIDFVFHVSGSEDDSAQHITQTLMVKARR